MGKITLEVRQSADLYLQEADLCANHSPKVLGFAAMTTAMSCVVAFGQALLGEPKPPDEKCISAFCEKMSNFDWLLTAQGQVPNRNPADILTAVRNALVHALSLPNDVCLVPAPERFKATEDTGRLIGIVPSLFVQSVRETLDNIEIAQPKFDFDLLADQKKRSPVQVTTNGSSASISKSSSVQDV